MLSHPGHDAIELAKLLTNVVEPAPAFRLRLLALPLVALCHVSKTSFLNMSLPSADENAEPDERSPRRWKLVRAARRSMGQR
jgi:hypothetical protein